MASIQGSYRNLQASMGEHICYKMVVWWGANVVASQYDVFLHVTFCASPTAEKN